MKFSYIALNKNNKQVTGNIEANDREAALSAIKKIGYKPLTVKEEKKKILDISFGQRKVKNDELVIFTRQLSTMISAGVPLLRSLEALSSKGKTTLQIKIKSIIKDIEGGITFSEALAKHPETFDRIYVNMVKAGEAAGILDDILKRLALQQEKSATIRKKIKSAMAYPTVLMVVTIVAFFGLMLFVIPQLGKIIADMSDGKNALPLITRIMLKISAFFVQFWYIVFPIIGGGVYGFLRFTKTPKGKSWVDATLLKLPNIKTLMKKIVVARFTRTFSALIGSGVSVIQALEVSAEAIGNEVYAKSLAQAVKEVKNGRQLSEIIEADPKLWPEIVSQMLAVGEETGNTDTVLLKVADFYEEEVDLAIEQLNSIIEPVMIVIMGAVVGLIVISVMSPITNLAKNIQ